MSNKGVTTVFLDEKTKNIIDSYGEKHALSRSAVIRLAVNDFFIGLGRASK